MEQFFNQDVLIAVGVQPLWLRIIKFPILLVILFLIYKKFHWKGVVISILSVIIIGTSVHFFLQWKTDNWRHSWGPVTIPLEVKK